MAEGQTEKADEKKSDSGGFGMWLTVAGIKQKFPSVKNITTGTLSNMLKSSTKSESSSGQQVPHVILLDTRAEEEYNVGHISGSRRVNYKDSAEGLMSAIPELLSAGGSCDKTTVVCYCSAGYRSSMVAEKIEEYLKKHGDANRSEIKVYNLEGSIFKWANEGRQMFDKNNAETKYAHPYNTIFGKLLKKELRKTSLDDTN